MKALVLTAPGTLVTLDVPNPRPAADEVLVRVHAAGICGSDVHGMDGSTGRRIPPIVMGHEAAGIVEAVGTAVTGWQPGEAVTFDSTVWCGSCARCLAGDVNLCDRRRVLGVSCDEYRLDGAFAELVVVPARILFAIPSGVSLVEAALTEPLAVAAHAVSRAPVAGVDTVLVVGAGLIGLLVVAVLRAQGAGRIVVTDLNPGRLERARALGADDIVAADAPDVTERILALTDGRGPDVAFEAVGVQGTVSLALAAVRKGGTVVLVGNLAPTVTIPLQWTVSRQLTLAASAASAGEYPACLGLIASRRVDVGSLVSAVAPLAEGAAWFERLRAPGTDLLKVVLEP